MYLQTFFATVDKKFPFLAHSLVHSVQKVSFYNIASEAKDIWILARNSNIWKKMFFSNFQIQCFCTSKRNNVELHSVYLLQPFCHPKRHQQTRQIKLMKKFQITEITMQSLKVNQIWKIKVKSDTVDYHGTNHLCLEADTYNVLDLKALPCQLQQP